jgi:hypothetical protein
MLRRLFPEWRSALILGIVLVLIVPPVATLSTPGNAFIASAPNRVTSHHFDLSRFGPSILPDTSYVVCCTVAAWPANQPAAFDQNLSTLVGAPGPNPNDDTMMELEPGGWEPLQDANSSKDQGHYEGPLVYDPVMHALLSYAYSTVRAYTNGSWTALPLGRGPYPPSTSQPSLIEDPVLGGMVMYGGSVTKNLTANQPTSDTWLFRGGQWKNLSANFTIHPSPRYGASFFYDPANGLAYLIGGVGPRGIVYETWALSATGWTNLTGSLAIPPPLMNGGAVTYDSTLGAPLAIGPGSLKPGINTTYLIGNLTYENTPVGYTEEWELNGASWVNVTEGSGPLPFTGIAGMLADDPAVGGVVVEGGYFSYYGGGMPTCSPDYPAVCNCVDHTVSMPVLGQPWLSYTWSFSRGGWSILNSGGSVPPPYTTYSSSVCSYGNGPVWGMMFVGVGTFAVLGGALAVMFYRDNRRLRNAGSPPAASVISDGP